MFLFGPRGGAEISIFSALAFGLIFVLVSLRKTSKTLKQVFLRFSAVDYAFGVRILQMRRKKPLYIDKIVLAC